MRPIIKEAIFADFCGNRLSLKQIRDRLEASAKAVQFKLWLDNPMKIATEASRINQLFQKTVLHPLMPYHLNLGNICISGEYAILRSRRKRPILLQMMFNDVYARPSLVHFARFQHFLESADDQIPLNLHIHPGKSRSFLMEYQPDQALRSLKGFFRMQQCDAYPVPGPHCSSCTPAPCLNRHEGE